MAPSSLRGPIVWGSRPGALVSVCGVLAVLLAGCGAASDFVAPKCTAAVRKAAPQSGKLVPRCGVILGVATDPNTLPQLQRVERATGRRFDMVYRFHDLDDPVPTADERAVVASGRILHVSIDARLYSSPSTRVTWSDIASGRYDSDLVKQAHGIASIGAPVFVTFDHEPDNPTKASRGSPADFIAAWRHVHDVFERAGARNAVWVWVVMGWPPAIPRAALMWPGNRYVDWISWEAYNASGCRSSLIDSANYRTFEQTLLPFYRWLLTEGPSRGIDIHKPMMLSEAGSVAYPGDPARSADWYAGIPEVLARYPDIRAIGLWDRPGTGTCDYEFSAHPAAQSAVAKAGRALAAER
jgi:hypothetical protein